MSSGWTTRGLLYPAFPLIKNKAAEATAGGGWVLPGIKHATAAAAGDHDVKQLFLNMLLTLFHFWVVSS